MQTPRIQISTWLAVLGWVLVIGGIVELFDLLFHHHWHHRVHYHSLLHELVDGPAVHLGFGSALWALARR